jgi:hypothetical protein
LSKARARVPKHKVGPANKYDVVDMSRMAGLLSDPPGQIDGSVELPESGQSTKKSKVGDIESSDWDEKESKGQSNNQLSP